MYSIIGIPRVAFATSRQDGVDWVGLSNRLALDGILFLPNQLRASNSNILMALVIHHGLETRGSLYLLANSLGGSVQASLGFHDCSLATRSTVAAVVYGLVASSSVLIVAKASFRGGTKHGRFMLHQSEGQQFGQTAEVYLAACEVIRLQAIISALVAEVLLLPQTGTLLDYEQYISTPEALSIRLLDAVV